MTLQTKDFNTLVREQVTAVQGTSRSLVDLTIGSILRAIIEAYSAVALWLQALILQLLATVRAATSSGTDLDSWMLDYGVTRLAAVAATGQVTFSRFTATSQAVILIGSVVQTADGTQQYKVTIDTNNVAYSSSLGGYVIAAGTSSVTAPITALIAGAAGNAVIGGINTLGQAIPYVDTVTNAAALTNGKDAEIDAALRTRFVAYIASLSKATKVAVGYAATSVATNITYTLTENQLYNGTAQMGYFYLVVDDGTGTPSSILLSSVSNAVDAVRPITSTFGIFAPVVVTANVSMVITTAAGYDHTATVALVVTALKNYINSLPLGTTLPWSRLSQVAYDASAGIANVSAVLLNGGTSDLTATNQQVIKYGTVTVS